MASAVSTSFSEGNLRRRHGRQNSASSCSSTSEFEQDDWHSSVRHPTHIADEARCETAARFKSADEKVSSLLALPLEIIAHHLLPQLNYPSLLALRLSHPRFYHSPVLYPPRAAAIRLRVAWLLERGSRGMQRVTPQQSGSVDIGSDRSFLANRQVQLMLREERIDRSDSSWMWQALRTVWRFPPGLDVRVRIRYVLQIAKRLVATMAIALTVAVVTIVAFSSSAQGVAYFVRDW